MADFSPLVNSRLATSATRATACSETAIRFTGYRKAGRGFEMCPSAAKWSTTLRGLREVNRPGIGATGDRAEGRLIEQREIARQGGLAHVVPIDFRLQRLDHAAVIGLKLFIGNILQHLFFAAKGEGCRTRQPWPKRHMHHFQMRQLRPRPNEAHVATQHIDELGQLIQLVLAQETAESGHSWVATLGQRGPVFLSVKCHGPELEHGEQDPMTSHALMAEDHRARGLVADYNGFEER